MERIIRFNGILLSLSLLLLSSGALAQTYLPLNFTIEGRLFDNGSPAAPINDVVDIQLELIDPAAPTCVIYREVHDGVDVQSADSSLVGRFAVRMGSGSTVNFGGANNLVNAFGGKAVTGDNSTTPFDNTADAACARTPAAATNFQVRISIKQDAAANYNPPLTPNTVITSIPQALAAETLQGKTPNEFLQVNSTGFVLTQANLQNIFTSANYTELTALLGGTSIQYLQDGGGTMTGPINMGSQLITNVAAPTAATDAVNRGWVDSHVGDKAADLSGVGAGMNNGHTLVWDAGGNRWITGVPSAVDNTKLPLTGGIMSGAITMSGFDIYNAGHITMGSQRLLMLGTYTNAQEGGLALGAGDEGRMFYNTDADVVKVWNGSAYSGFMPAGAAGGALTGNYPNPSIANSAITTAMINDDAVTAAKIGQDAVQSEHINQAGIGLNRIVMSDGTTGTTLQFRSCALGEVLLWGASGWACAPSASIIPASGVTAGTYGSATAVAQFMVNAQGVVTAASDVAINFPVTSVNGLSGAVTLNGSHLGLGTASLEDAGNGANELPILDGSGKLAASTIPNLPAVDGSALTNVNAATIRGVNVSTTAPISQSQFLGYNGSAWVAKEPNYNDLINGASVYFTYQPNNTACGLNQVLKWDNTRWVCGNDDTGGSAVTLVQAGAGLTGGTITGTGTISVDVGTTDGQIVQVQTGGRLPALDGSQLTDVDAVSLQGQTVSATAPGGGQVLKFTGSQWEPAADANSGGTVTLVTAGPGLLGGNLTTTGTLSVDIGTGANQIVQLDGSAQLPAVNGSLLTNVNATKLQTYDVLNTLPANNQVLTWVAANSRWEPQNLPASADNLGDHTATQNIRLNGFWLSGDGGGEGIYIPSTGNVGVGTNAPDANAILDVNGLGSMSAMLVPRDSSANRPNGVNGMIRYNINTARFEAYESGNWVNMTAIGAGTGDFLRDGSLAMTGNFRLGGFWLSDDGGNEGIRITNSGQVGIGAVPSVDATLQVGGTGQIILPIGTTLQRASTSQAGMLRYNSDFQHLEAHVMGSWHNLVAGHAISSQRALFVGPGLGSNGNTTGLDNSALGFHAGQNLTTGSRNTALGTYALTSATNASYNTAIGANAMDAALSALDNVAIGYDALGNLTGGNDNVAIGSGAGNQTNGTANILIGHEAGSSSTSGNGNIMIGAYKNLPNPTGNDQLNIGNLIYGVGMNGSGNVVSQGRVAIGTQVPSSGAVLELYGTGQNFSSLLVPRDSTDERPTGINGMIRYNTSLAKFEVYEDNLWKNMISSSSSPWSVSGGDIYYNSGSVGIGTSTPTSALHLETFTNATYGITIDNRSAGSNAFATLATRNDLFGVMEIGIGGTSVAGSEYQDRAFLLSSGGALGISIIADTGDIRMYTGATEERMRIDNQGRVGIGTTPHPYAILDVNGLGAASSMIVPRGTNFERGQITTTINGMLRYNTDSNKFEVYEAGTWTNIQTGATGVYAADVGSSGSPSITFSGDSDTGLYSSGPNSIGISSGGTPILNISSTGLTSATAGGAHVSSAAGTPGAPTFSFVGDTDTGWWSPLADTLAASTGGTERMRIGSSGSVGIGTTSPQARLEVKTPAIGSIYTNNSITQGQAPTFPITLNTTTNMPTTGLLSIGGEIMAYSVVNSTQVNITARALLGTSAMNHSVSNNPVSLVGLVSSGDGVATAPLVTRSDGSASIPRLLSGTGEFTIGTVPPNLNLSIGSTTIPTGPTFVPSTAGWPSSGIMLADGEMMSYYVTGPSNIQITGRGLYGTIPVTHTSPTGIRFANLLTSTPSQATGQPMIGLFSDGEKVGIGTALPSGSIHVFKEPPIGTISTSGTSVTGTSTNFMNAFTVGDLIVANGQTRQIRLISSQTFMTVDVAFSPSLPGGTAYSRVGALLNSGLVGIGTTTPVALLDVHGTGRASSGEVRGHNVDLNYAPTLGSSADVAAQEVDLLSIGSSNLSSASLTASVANTKHANSAPLGNAQGLVGTVENTGTGSITNAIGVSASIKRPNGTITYGTGLSIGQVQATNAYGININDIEGSTNSFGIYQAGSDDKNFFAGNVGIGTASPSAKLEVNGTLAMSSLKGTGTPPPCTVGPGVGGTTSCAVSGTSTAHTVTVNSTASSSTAGASIVRIDFPTPFSAPPHCVFSPGNSAAATLFSTATVHIGTVSNGSYHILKAGTGNTGGVTYIWTVHCIE